MDSRGALVRFLPGARDSLFSKSSTLALGPTQLYRRLYSLGVKRPGREVNQLSPPSAVVQNAWSYTRTAMRQAPSWREERQI